MRTIRSGWYRLRDSWQLVFAAGATVAAIGLLWRVRDAPLELAAGVRVDALSAFFMLLLLAELALSLALRGPKSSGARVVSIALLLFGLSTTSVLLLAGSYLLVALVPLLPGLARRLDWPRSWRAWLALLGRDRAERALGPIAAASLALGYGTLALRGAPDYTAPSAGAALDSFVFWFVLLAAAIPLLPFRSARPAPGPGEAAPHFSAGGRSIACMYPLLRMYSLGPWNTGWSLAAILLGGALAGWCALAAFGAPQHHDRYRHIRAGYLGLVLAGIGLATSAGIAAACFGLLAQLVLALDWLDGDGSSLAATGDRLAGPSQPAIGAFLAWLLAGIFPFAAPFVALWLLLSASVAAGVSLLAGVAWLAGLLNGLALVLWGSVIGPARRRAAIALATISLALGIGAPLVIRAAVQPVVAQLQGGLLPYGDIAIWPWVGLGTTDAASAQVSTMPSIAIALLMLVLAALAYVVVRLLALYSLPTSAQSATDAVVATADPADMDANLRRLRADVPWLALLLGARSAREEAPRERE